MNVFGRLENGWNAGIDWCRRHSKIFDHAWLARQRYNEVLGGRLAAAIAYYGFFAVFALALVAYSVVGFVLANSRAAANTVNRFLNQNIPFLDVSAITEARNAVAIAGLVVLVFTGVGWIESLRSSQRAIWRLEQQPGNLFIRRILDLATMAGIGLLLALSLWVQAGINDAVKPFLLRLSPESIDLQGTINLVARLVGILLGLMVNVVLAVSLLSGVSRLRMPLRRLIPSTLLVAIGLSVLSTVGRLYIDYGAGRPVYKVVGGTVALLLFLYLFNQLLLYGAALAATSTHGEITDLAAAARPAEDTQKPDHESAGTAERPAVHDDSASKPIGPATVGEVATHGDSASTPIGPATPADGERAGPDRTGESTTQATTARESTTPSAEPAADRDDPNATAKDATAKDAAGESTARANGAPPTEVAARPGDHGAPSDDVARSDTSQRAAATRRSDTS